MFRPYGRFDIIEGAKKQKTRANGFFQKSFFLSEQTGANCFHPGRLSIRQGASTVTAPPYLSPEIIA